jgi:hypothetical protein
MRTFLAAMLTLRVRFIKRVDFHKITSKMVLFGFTGGAVLFLINRTYLLQKKRIYRLVFSTKPVFRFGRWCESVGLQPQRLTTQT